MRKLVLVRHGETEWNSDNRVQGSVDVPLSAVGIEQARALGAGLRAQGMTFGRVYTSDLDRSRTTGQILQEALDIPVLVTSPLLRELDCGDWEGEPIADLKKNKESSYKAWKHDPTYFIPNGESLMAVHERVRVFLEEQKATLDACDDVLIVAHGLLNRMMLAVLLQLDPQQSRYFSQDNTAYDVFEWVRERVYCTGWNLTCHLNGCGPEENGNG